MRTAFSLAQPPGVFRLLAHELRWNIVTLLARSDHNGQELVRLLKQPQNLVSYHVRLLTEHQLITERRSSADERSIYYSLDLTTLRSLYLASGEALHPALGGQVPPEVQLQSSVQVLPHRRVRVLFLCTHNSARSQMAEGILRSLSQDRIEVMSAGSQPSQLHPLAVQACASLGSNISQQRSKHIDELKEHSFDYIVTVCDRVREACPTWPDDPERIHWSLPDPTEVQGSEEMRYRAFEQTALQLLTRIRYLLMVIACEKGRES